MFLKDHLINTYQKASVEKNNLILEDVINRWVHRFGIKTINELVVEDQEEENQDQTNLIEKNHKVEIQDQINLELLDNIKYQKEIDLNSSDDKTIKIINKDIYDSYKHTYIDSEELPLPNIKNLRKWIKNDKKAS